VPVYLVVCGLVIWQMGLGLGREIFPTVDTGQFRLRLRAPDGTHFDRTEKLTLAALDIIKEKLGADQIDLTLGYVGSIPSSFPINGVFQWSRGPEEAILRVGLKPGSNVRVETAKEELRRELTARMPEVRFSFEPADIINEVMSFGSVTPIEVSVKGPTLPDSRAYAQKVFDQLAKIDAIRDLQVSQSLDYPTIDVQFDRERGGLSGVEASDVAKSLVAATSSSRFVVPNYWPDPKTGIGYQVQVQIPQRLTTTLNDIETIPVSTGGQEGLLLRDVATVNRGKMPGQYDRYNMKREVTLTANLAGEPLGNVASSVEGAIKAAELPKDAVVEIRGQIPPLNDLLKGLGLGLALAVVVVFLLLAANYQSIKLSIVTVSTAPAAVAGAVLALWMTHTTLNLQSFIGAIMAVGVAMANAILLVTFAEHMRQEGRDARASAETAASARLRPILMTTFAMIAGMLPMALGTGEGGDQVAPLGRAVIGGLAAATLSTLFVLPCVFTLIQRRAVVRSASLDPDDPHSIYHSVAP
jgi:multidrug efflux pump subunit AcrB